jgi:hypothetical protein
VENASYEELFRQRLDAMPVIEQDAPGLDRKRSTLTGRLEHRAKIANMFGQEF